MIKEFVVSKIETLQEDKSYLYIMLTDTKSNFSSTRRQRKFPEKPFGFAVIPVTSLDDLKNLPKRISDSIEKSFHGDDNNELGYITFKISLAEFEALGIKKGDKVMLEIKISNNDIGA
jgi:hypothetical protein